MKSSDLPGAVWRKSSFSNGQAECVETSELTDGSMAVRDSKDKSGPVHVFLSAGWSAFIEGVKRGEVGEV